MVRGLVWLAICILPLPAWSQPWYLAPPVDVTSAPREGVFHHLDSSGRQHVAVSGSAVAVTWEDNSRGSPGVYVATAAVNDPKFAAPVRISGDAEAYEPSVIAATAGVFLIAWEEGEGVWVRSLGSGAPGTTLKLAEHATQVSLTKGPANRVYVVWSEKQGRFYRIRGAELTVSGQGVTSEPAMWVDAHPADGDQSYPVSAYHALLKAPVVAWEDRRHENTVLLSTIGSFSTRFSIPMQVNELLPPRSGRYGRGSGVARIVVTQYGGGVAAAWADKRNFEFGYDIYAALARRSGRLGENMLVQDGFAEGYEQWHPTISSHREYLTVAWDDDRDDTSDIWLSWFASDTWSDDLKVPGASGPAQETHPSLTLDGDGNLHLVWIVRTAMDAPTQIRYAFGRLVN